MKTNKHWYNNGKQEKQCENCPKNWVKGRLPFTQEHIEQTRKARLGKAPWNKGLTKEIDSRLKLSSATKEAISKTTKGKKKSAEHAKHISEGLTGKIIPEEVRQKISNTLKGKPIPTEILKIRQEKEYATKLLRGTFNSSKSESLYYNQLINLFDQNEVIKQYNLDNRYPFAVDFFIKSMDIFIECNFHQSHYKHPFNPNSMDDVNYLQKIISKQNYYTSKDGKQKKNSYFKFEEVFSKKDPQKLNVALTNKLNYVLIYPKDCYFYKDGNLIFTQHFSDLLYSNNEIIDVISLLKSIYSPTTINTNP